MTDDQFSSKGQIINTTLTLHYDSQSTIHLVQNLVYHLKIKHIEVRYHHIWELIINKKLKAQKFNTKVNITYCLTKPVLDHHFKSLRRQMGLQVDVDKKAKSKEGEEGPKGLIQAPSQRANQP